jgi:predicted ATPase/class 3 adenylate cyclase
MASLTVGTITLLFTDIEGSTRLLQRLGDRYADVLMEHHRLLGIAVEEHAGQVLDSQGDALFAAFPRARDALAAAVAAQRAIAAHPWPEGAAVRVRMGLHTGEPIKADMGYVGVDVHRTARICAAGHGGQILLSQATRGLVADDLPRAVSLRDLGEHRLKDLARPQRLFQVVVADLSADFPPLRSLDVPANNLPVQLTSFIGRQRELGEVRELLAKSRLVTLAGAGGCGKTRLALHVAANLLDEFTDGVWLVELAALSDPALVLQTTAAALGVWEPADGVLLQTLIDSVRSRHALLLLDNCEHLITSCADLARALLQSCPRLTIMATSREPLAVEGEVTYLVTPLLSPDPSHLPSLENLVQYEAVRLFLERAASSMPGFTIGHSNALPIAQVCHQLDGIPLAIELAAARVKTLSVEQIARRLDERFRLLTTGPRTASPHHQTLQAVMDWSYGLLSGDERILFRRLSVFAGSFTLDAAEAICAGEGLDAAAVLDLLAQLVLKSLVVRGGTDTEVRFWLLETVRQYGWRKLHEAGETACVRRQHHAYFLELVERGAPALQGPDQAAWLARLEAEHDNLRAVLEWCGESGDPEGALELSGALWWFWYVRGYHREGRHWLERALKSSSGAPPVLQAKALSGAAFLATDQGDFAAASLLLEQSLELYRGLDDKAGVARALYGLGRVALRQEDLPRAAALYEDALALFKELEATESIGGLMNGLGVFATIQGEFPRARSLFQESLAISRAVGNMRGIALSIANLGVLAFREGDHASARSLVKESLAIDRELGDKRGIASELEELAVIEAARGQGERSARLLGAAEAMREAIGAPLSLLDRAFCTYDNCVAILSTALSREAVAVRWAEGRAMTLEKAFEYAMEETA